MTRLKWVRSCTVVLGLASIVAGCATSPVEDSGLPVATPGQSQAQMKREDYQAKVARLVERNPLFALMTAEIAQQRGDAYSAMLAYLEAAKQLQDPELAKRALEISLGEGQLEEELAQNAWLTVPANQEILFDTPLHERFASAYAMLGIDPTLMTGAAGHALGAAAGAGVVAAVPGRGQPGRGGDHGRHA